MINLLKYDKEYEGLIEVKGEYVAYAVAGEADNYVEQTSRRLRQLAQTMYTFPFYLYFESYYDSLEWVLQEMGFDIRYKASGRTVLTQTGQKMFQAEVPTFTVAITNQVLLDQSFQLWFQNAFDNHLWAITQDDVIYYENGFAAVDLMKDMTILIAEHDASGFTVVTNQADYQSESLLQGYLEKVIKE
ncbi:hypothetical protein [Solibacillus sp. FSL K6-1523]|uniref:hypothetical protein n=1 Tax=Solibacillus sp. FSL K6-1523 TaxID=2921471 RepID=UPI0030F72474